MYGESVETLNVYTRTEIGGPLTREWSRTGEVGDYYERTEISLIASKPFEVKVTRRRE